MKILFFKIIIDFEIMSVVFNKLITQYIHINVLIIFFKCIISNFIIDNFNVFSIITNK